MANFLDEHRDIVQGYTFNSVKVDSFFFNNFIEEYENADSEMWDLSHKNKYTINLFA